MGDYKGMNIAKATDAMGMIQELKKQLTTESTTATTSLTDCVGKAFAGSQTGAMQGYITRINEALENLYSYLDGKESNFATTFNEAINSYAVSDENVASSYNNSSVE